MAFFEGFYSYFGIHDRLMVCPGRVPNDGWPLRKQQMEMPTRKSAFPLSVTQIFH